MSENFSVQVTEQVTEQVELLINILSEEMSRQELQDKLSLSHRENFRSHYLKPTLNLGLIEMTLPEKPNSRLQRYRLTPKGNELVRRLSKQ